MFEDDAAAKKYAKDNNIKTNWFSRTFGGGSKIAENKDGTWSIDNKKEGSSIFQDK
jgi:chitinase